MIQYIERSRANDVLINNTPLKGSELEEAVNAICSIPAADVRPVVMCRDCKHKGWVQEPEHGKSVDYCHLIERYVDKRFFCAAGEKREEMEDDNG